MRAQISDIATSNSLADLAAELLREDHPHHAFFSLCVAMRSAGASIRAMARCFGCSKSSMGRLLPLIEAGVSHVGHDDGNSPAIPERVCPTTGQAEVVS
jgi:hypothetical protein